MPKIRNVQATGDEFKFIHARVTAELRALMALNEKLTYALAIAGADGIVDVQLTSQEFDFLESQVSAGLRECTVKWAEADQADQPDTEFRERYEMIHALIQKMAVSKLQPIEVKE